MNAFRLIALMGLGLSVTACATVDTPTRNAPYEQLPSNAVPVGTDFSNTEQPEALTVTKAAMEMPLAGDPLAIVPGQAPVHVEQLSVYVPRSLKVSEANSYLPKGDIVWRGDPIGDRHAQVQKIFEDALLTGVQPMSGPIPVNLEIKVTRFHAMSEKARYTTGGLHSITFDLAIKSVETGELLVPVRTIRADLDGFGGRQALLADARGETQKVRISNHLAEVIRQELSNPEGYANANLGFFQMLNNI